MSKVSVYLNFPGTTEEAFNFYKKVFGTDFIHEISRFGDIPPSEEMPPLPDAEKNKVMHVGLQLLGGFELMGSDMPGSMEDHLNPGNNVFLNLQPDTREETSRLFNALADGGKILHQLQDMFWGAYYGSCIDKFGICWSFNCEES